MRKKKSSEQAPVHRKKNDMMLKREKKGAKKQRKGWIKNSKKIENGDKKGCRQRASGKHCAVKW